MNVETLIAIGAAAIAMGALYFNRLSTRASILAAHAAEEQTAIQRELRIEASQPYVWVDVRPDDATGTLLNLVLGNSGPTVATRIRVQFDPALPSIDRFKARAESAQHRLAGGFESLPPGRTLSWPLGQGFNLLKDDGPQVHTCTVNADGPFGPVPPLTYVVDLSDYVGVLDRPAGSLHQLTLAVKDLNKSNQKVQKRRESGP